jgi:chromosomal replication initiator protein
MIQQGVRAVSILPVRPERVLASGQLAVSIYRIAHVVCRVLGVEFEDVLGTRRHPPVVLARWLIFHLARRHTRLSYPEIARATGRPTHSTVVAGDQRMAAMLAAEPEEQPVVELGGEILLITELYRRIERDVRAEVP